jgi:glycosyltransferase involved in cell wall biosynthesis
MKNSIKKKSKITLSVVIHTKNEEKMLADCLKSVLDIADEIIVADMNSTDDTKKIAKKFGARIINVPEFGFADPARNISLSKVTKDWVLVIDADERLTSALRKGILSLIKKGEYDGARFPIKNIMLGKWIQYGMRWPDYQNRLFRKGYAKWTDKIHEKAVYKGKIYEFPSKEKFGFIHYNCDSIEYLMEKTYRYASKEKYYDNQKNLNIESIYKRMEGDFPWRFFEHQGYKDGTHGLIVNKFMEVYRFLEFALYWERSGKPEIATTQELKELWDTEGKLIETMKELNRIKDSKFYIFYKLYEKVKKTVRNNGK